MKERIIGIIGAMPEETDGILALLSGKETVCMGRRDYHTGKINGIPVVVVFSRWGKVAAATTVSTLILKFGITGLIFTGVAGAVQPHLRIGDIIVGTRLVQHDMDARPLLPRFEMPLLAKVWFETDARLTGLAVQAVEHLLNQRHLHRLIADADLQQFSIVHPRVMTGAIASGDQFFSGAESRHRLLEQLPEVLCVEMEGAAVAQVCFEYGIPFTIIRTLSDAADETSAIDFPAFIRLISRKYSVAIIENIFGHRAERILTD